MLSSQNHADHPYAEWLEPGTVAEEFAAEVGTSLAEVGRAFEAASPAPVSARRGVPVGVRV